MFSSYSFSKPAMQSSGTPGHAPPAVAQEAATPRPPRAGQRDVIIVLAGIEARQPGAAALPDALAARAQEARRVVAPRCLPFPCCQRGPGTWLRVSQGRRPAESKPPAASGWYCRPAGRSRQNVVTHQGRSMSLCCLICCPCHSPPPGDPSLPIQTWGLLTWTSREGGAGDPVPSITGNI